MSGYLLCTCVSLRYCVSERHLGRLSTAFFGDVLWLTALLMSIRYSILGASIGGVIAYALYHTVPAYQAFINWQFSLFGF